MRRVAAGLCALALALSGCADPYGGPEHKRPPSPPPGEQPAPRLPRRAEHVDQRDLASTPEEAARRAAELTTNWTGRTVASRYAELARTSIGAARRDARQSAARLPTDGQLTSARTRSSGTVEAVAARSRGTREREFVVVTHEIVISDGLRDDRWRVTLATAELRIRGWVISRWEPQP